jgi:hypothetical protein
VVAREAVWTHWQERARARVIGHRWLLLLDRDEEEEEEEERAVARR